MQIPIVEIAKEKVKLIKFAGYFCFEHLRKILIEKAMTIKPNKIPIW